MIVEDASPADCLLITYVRITDGLAWSVSA
jgi:hypothetical protein